MTDVLTGSARVLNLADRMRRVGGPVAHHLYSECVGAFRRGEIAFDDVGVLYRHAMIHAGGIVPRDRERFLVCPECAAALDGVPDGD